MVKHFLSNNDKYKSFLIRSPLQGALSSAFRISAWIRSLNRPELRELLLEPARIERVTRRLVGRASNCIDIGCHLGSVLSLLIKLAPEGKHMAFEPVPRKASWLRRKFPEVEVFEVALGDTPGKVKFFESLTRSSFSAFLPTGVPEDVDRELIVDCERLDRYLPDDRSIAFIKLKAEGAEFLVLRGAVELIRRDHPSLIFQSLPGGVERFGDDRRRFFDFLTRELGYRIFLAADFLAGGGPLDWDRFDRAHTYPFQAMNYVGIPLGHRRSSRT